MTTVELSRNGSSHIEVQISQLTPAAVASIFEVSLKKLIKRGN